MKVIGSVGHRAGSLDAASPAMPSAAANRASRSASTVTVLQPRSSRDLSVEASLTGAVPCQSARRSAITALSPPNAKEFETAQSIRIGRASFGT
jgi:hypothetical protein